ncbi:rhomboid family intramembrane serine protease, partial [Bacillus altitudinis]|uniref:rhomboid family intramembrane serine protease n=1 Tax=Bacillus altitudinis TaxID=293387 RepID=UPI003B51A2AC
MHLPHHHLLPFNYPLPPRQCSPLLTPIFLHPTLTHILFNSISLFLFPPPLHYFLPNLPFLVIYLPPAFIPNLPTYSLHPLQYLHLPPSPPIFPLFPLYLYLLLFKPH